MFQLDSYLQSAIDDINELIRLTRSDIENIIKADHQKVFERTTIKEDILNSFNYKRMLIESELKKIKANVAKGEESPITDETVALIEKLKEGFVVLKNENKRYAKFVLSVSEFYNSLLEKIAPSKEQYGYNLPQYKSSFLKMSI